MTTQPSPTAVVLAFTLGARAGSARRASGIPQRCPFDSPSLDALRDVWTRAYVAAAYASS